MKKGFTLMEMLAVVLVIAIVVSMAAPAYRNVRHQMKNNQAQAATKKLAEAVRTYYQESRGYTITGCFTPTDTTDTTIKTITCAEGAPGATGIPSSSVTVSPTVSSLFGCGYLSFKDFQNLPYTFCSYSASFPSTLGTAPSYAVAPIYAYSYGATGVGEKFAKSKGYIFVDGTMKVKDTYD